MGCALASRVVAVDEFVLKNCDKMAESALFKLAALFYKTKVAEPAEAEGVEVPEWSWKELRAHYLCDCRKLGQFTTIRIRYEKSRLTTSHTTKGL